MSITARLSQALIAGAVLVPAAALAQAPRLDVPYVPTPPAVVERMLELGAVGREDVVIDLGSGDGRIAIAAVKEREAKSALGVDLNPERIREAQENAKAAGVSEKVQFQRGDLFEMKLDDATVITMYLLETVNAKLRPRLLDLRPGTRLVSHAFTMGDWEADRREVVDGRVVYLWVVPAKVDGTWKVTDGQTSFTIDLDQTFQKVTGVATLDGQQVPLQTARLDGADIELVVGTGTQARTLKGRVNGSTIQPVASAGGDAGTWRAERG